MSRSSYLKSHFLNINELLNNWLIKFHLPIGISALKLFPVAQNLGATFWLPGSLQVTLELLTAKEKNWV
jgi:hypothetical protein